MTIYEDDGLTLRPEADLRLALRRVPPTFTLLEPVTPYSDLFWRGWDTCCNWELRFTDPLGITVPPEIGSSDGFQGILRQRRRHRKKHGCKVDLRCARCGCFCVYHEIGGPCFSRHSVCSLNMTRGFDGSPAPRRLTVRFCNCPGFVPTT